MSVDLHDELHDDVDRQVTSRLIEPQFPHLDQAVLAHRRHRPNVGEDLLPFLVHVQHFGHAHHGRVVSLHWSAHREDRGDHQLDLHSPFVWPQGFLTERQKERGRGERERG